MVLGNHLKIQKACHAYVDRIWGYNEGWTITFVLGKTSGPAQFLRNHNGAFCFHHSSSHKITSKVSAHIFSRVDFIGSISRAPIMRERDGLKWCCVCTTLCCRGLSCWSLSSTVHNVCLSLFKLTCTPHWSCIVSRHFAGDHQKHSLLACEKQEWNGSVQWLLISIIKILLLSCASCICSFQST